MSKPRIEKCPVLNKNVTITLAYVSSNLDQQLSPIPKLQGMSDCNCKDECGIKKESNLSEWYYDWSSCPIATIFNKNG